MKSRCQKCDCLLYHKDIDSTVGLCCDCVPEPAPVPCDYAYEGKRFTLRAGVDRERAFHTYGLAGCYLMSRAPSGVFQAQRGTNGDIAYRPEGDNARMDSFLTERAFHQLFEPTERAVNEAEPTPKVQSATYRNGKVVKTETPQSIKPNPE